MNTFLLYPADNDYDDVTRLDDSDYNFDDDDYSTMQS